MNFNFQVSAQSIHYNLLGIYLDIFYNNRVFLFLKQSFNYPNDFLFTQIDLLERVISIMKNSYAT